MCILEFKNVSKKYPYVKQDLLFDVSFCVKKGQRVGIVAEKQCGKSSLIKMIAQLTKPTTGQILLDGRDIENLNLQNEKVGIIFDDFALIKGKSVLENVEFPLKARKQQNAKQIVAEQVEKFDLQDVSKTKAKNLDNLQKLKTALARLDSRKDLALVVFDDIFANIPRQDAIKYIDLFLQNRQTSILQTASDVDHLCDCDVVYVVAEGTLAFVGNFEQAKQYIEKTQCFDKFGINEQIEKILKGD